MAKDSTFQVSDDVMTEMYSLYFRETEEVVDELRHSADFHQWFGGAWDGRQDAAPYEFLAAWAEWSGFPLQGYSHLYVGHGSSELIRELMTPSDKYPNPHSVLTLRGEYAGYSYTSIGRGLGNPHQVTLENGILSRIPHEWAHSEREPVFWISQPSALNGEYLKNLGHIMDQVSSACPRARFVLDVCYHGLGYETCSVPEVADERVIAVLFSMSKLFGMYKWRVGGMFSRRVIPGLEFNRHFNVLFGLKVAMQMMRRYKAGEIPRKYRDDQVALVEKLVQEGTLPPDSTASNVLLLARSNMPHEDARCNRAPGISRYCITPGLSNVLGLEGEK